MVASYTINRWISRGVKSPNYLRLYRQYLKAKYCENCGIKFDNSIKSQRKCMDHCHESGKFRFFLCSRCNLNFF